MTREEQIHSIIKLARETLSLGDTINWSARNELREALEEYDSNFDLDRAKEVFTENAAIYLGIEPHVNAEAGLARVQAAMAGFRAAVRTNGSDDDRRRQMGKAIGRLSGELLRFSIDLLEIDEL